MENLKSFKDKIKSKAVNDCLTLIDFLNKYRLHNRFKGRDGKDWGFDYSKKIIESHENDLRELGYTSISKYESVTSKPEYFILNK